ncbi:tRNA pseudouridine(38-40) synthase TruA [Thorsellia anophelis]|uniref:tRNA pseudouridine synthase A n=1 Tax=Thorsellia anophelis DSM 18579 TaxID=1123402 RepID=A0A1H9YTY4_9GAMM|nr:tRNA pseudouridine(38-40) synthase TruA [Thorsellia anophelis]SES72528.1 tRNA pseudouridine38-40 synthase [Thorsellia anophelis DSM 18579]
MQPSLNNNNELPLLNYAMGIEYDGSRYAGWQRQHHAVTVQGELEKALSHIANEVIEVQCAGRTDAGVHATCQIVHFKTHVQRAQGAWTLGVNSQLPPDIAVKFAMPIAQDFHARFSAQSRRYRYVIYNHRLRPAILQSGLTQCFEPLDEMAMHRAAQSLVGEHDFTSFRALACQSHSPWRNLEYISVKRIGAYVVIEVQANAFLHHMVRNIAGSLIQVGIKAKPEKWIAELLTLKNRQIAAATAKPNGLYLVHVNYPDHFNLPKFDDGPLFLSNLPTA